MTRMVDLPGRRMLALAVVCALGWLAGPPVVPTAHAAPGQQRACPPPAALKAQGLVSVTEYGATPNDRRDDDVHAIQEAVFDAFERGKAVYCPPGTYHVGDTVRVMLPLRAAPGVSLELSLDGQGRVLLNGEHSRPGMDRVLYVHPVSGVYQSDRSRTNVLLGARCGNRPTLRLHDWAPGFDDPAAPRPVVQVWAQPRDEWASADVGNTDPALGQPSISFAQVFRGINIDLARHPGAVGISHPGAQGSTLEDVTVFASGGHAGVLEIPGQGAGSYNLKVIGGAYGIIASSRTKMPLVVGVELVRQSVRALQWRGNAPLTVVGFHIRRDVPGAPIELAGGGFGQQRTLNLVDGAIEVQSGETAVANPGKRSLYLQNVHVNRAGIIVDHPASPDLLAASSRWTRVARYAYNGVGAEALVNGIPTFAGTVGASEAFPESYPGWAPAVLVAPHLYSASDYPAMEDANAVWVQPDGDPDNDHQQIQQALDSSDSATVYLAAGTFRVDRTVTLGAHDRLFGVAATLSRIVASEDWLASEGTALVTTVDAAGGRAVLADLSLLQPPARARFTNLHWRVGAGSVVRQVLSGLTAWPNVSSAFARQTYLIDGPGGGTWSPGPGQAILEVLDLGPVPVTDLTVAGVGPVNPALENDFDTLRVEQPGGVQAIPGDRMASYLRMD